MMMMMMSKAAGRKIQYLYRTERAAAGGFYLYIAPSLSSFISPTTDMKSCAHLSCMPTACLGLACSKETDISMPSGQTVLDDEDDLPDNDNWMLSTLVLNYEFAW